jgi:hypothetical protein
MGQFMYRDRWRIEELVFGAGVLGQLSSNRKFVNFQCYSYSISHIFPPLISAGV